MDCNGLHRAIKGVRTNWRGNGADARFFVDEVDDIFIAEAIFHTIRQSGGLESFEDIEGGDSIPLSNIYEHMESAYDELLEEINDVRFWDDYTEKVGVERTVPFDEMLFFDAIQEARSINPNIRITNYRNPHHAPIIVRAYISLYRSSMSTTL